MFLVCGHWSDSRRKQEYTLSSKGKFDEYDKGFVSSGPVHGRVPSQVAAYLGTDVVAVGWGGAGLERWIAPLRSGALPLSHFSS
jgi:hypothetical protein